MAKRQRRVVPQGEFRTCARCGAGKVLQAQGTNSRAFCSACRAEARLARQRRYRESHRPQLQIVGREYQRKRRQRDDEYVERERQRIRALAGSEHLRRIRKRSYDKHAETLRARRRQRRLIRREAIYDRDRGLCHLCGLPVPWSEYEVDHVVPVARGGSHEMSNLAATHRGCNRHKSARLVEELTVRG